MAPSDVRVSTRCDLHLDFQRATKSLRDGGESDLIRILRLRSAKLLARRAVARNSFELPAVAVAACSPSISPAIAAMSTAVRGVAEKHEPPAVEAREESTDARRRGATSIVPPSVIAGDDVSVAKTWGITVQGL